MNEISSTVKIFSSHSRLSDPRRFVQESIQDLLSSRELALQLLKRNLRGQYRQSVLGYFWLVLPLIVSTLVWVVLNASSAVNFGQTEIPYTIYLVINLTLWQSFIEAIENPLKTLQCSRNLIAKVRFPHEALLLAGIGEILFTSIIRTIVVLLVLVVFGTPLSVTAPLAIVSYGVLILFGLALGLLIAPIGLLYTDVTRAIAVVSSIWFFATPIIYPPIVEWPWNLMNFLNPVTPLIVTTRELMTSSLLTLLPSFFLISSITLVSLLLVWGFFRIAIPHVIARLSS